jgi:hypothetical protein
MYVGETEHQHGESPLRVTLFTPDTILRLQDVADRLVGHRVPEAWRERDHDDLVLLKDEALSNHPVRRDRVA